VSEVAGVHVRVPKESAALVVNAAPFPAGRAERSAVNVATTSPSGSPDETWTVKSAPASASTAAGALITGSWSRMKTASFPAGRPVRSAPSVMTPAAAARDAVGAAASRAASRFVLDVAVEVSVIVFPDFVVVTPSMLITGPFIGASGASAPGAGAPRAGAGAARRPVGGSTVRGTSRELDPSRSVATKVIV
jgi:hypothetical protein